MDFHHVITSKGLENQDITFTKKNKIITRKGELAKIFNKHYVDIVEKSSGIKPKDIFQREKNQNIQKAIRINVKFYENHHSIL